MTATNAVALLALHASIAPSIVKYCFLEMPALVTALMAAISQELPAPNVMAPALPAAGGCTVNA
jgi:hypothetical protein